MDAVNELILQVATSPWLPLVMLASAVLDGFFPPVPSEMILVAAAAAASTGNVSVIVLVSLVGAIGATVGDNIAYEIGRRVGTTRFRWMRKPRVIAALERSRRSLMHRGTPLLLGARYIPVARVAVNMSAGALSYPRRRFVPLSIVSGIGWAGYNAVIGIVAGQWLQGQPLLSAAIGVVFALLVGVVIERIGTLRRRRREAAVSDDDRQLIGASTCSPVDPAA